MNDDCARLQAARRPATAQGACLTRRLLSGAGRVTLTTFADPDLAGIDTLGHRWSSATGRLLVACRGADPQTWRSVGAAGVEVRMQIEKSAVLPHVRVLTGSLHALGRMTVVGSPTQVWPVGEDLGPLAEAADHPDVWLCAIAAPRTLLHAAGRVEQHRPGDVMDGAWYPRVSEEFSAVDRVLTHGELAMARLAAAVLDGRRPGDSIRIDAPPPACGHLEDRVFPVDVSAHGLTMLLTGRDGAGLVTAFFDEPAGTAADLDRLVTGLLMPYVAQPQPFTG